jgi:hypothetical protein
VAADEAHEAASRSTPLYNRDVTPRTRRRKGRRMGPARKAGTGAQASIPQVVRSGVSQFVIRGASHRPQHVDYGRPQYKDASYVSPQHVSDRARPQHVSHAGPSWTGPRYLAVYRHWRHRTTERRRDHLAAREPPMLPHRRWRVAGHTKCHSEDPSRRCPARTRSPTEVAV